MLNAIAALGILVLGAAGGTTTVAAATDTSPPGALICHLTDAGTYEPFFVTVHGLIHDLNGHAAHAGDIIPFPGFGGNPAGQNMTPENVAILNNGCIGQLAPPAAPALPIATPAPAIVPTTAAGNLGYNVDGAVAAGSSPAASGDASDIWSSLTWALLAAAAAGAVWKARVLRGKDAC